MSHDITLIMIPPWEPKMPPLGLAYICEYLKSRKLKPRVLDFNLQLFRGASPGKKIFWNINNINSMSPYEIARRMSDLFREEIDEMARQVASFDCGLVGFSVNIASIGLASRIAALIKKMDRDKVIIFGGTGCFWPQDRRIISPKEMWAIDAFVIGEGEEALERIIENYKQGKSLEGIPGVICRKEDFLKPAGQFFTKDIDKLPFPAFSNFDLSSYNEKKVPMLISRGCIGSCAFCIDHLMCGAYRFRSPENILKEIKYHLAINKINNFGFCDLVCNGNLKQLEDFCGLIIESKLDIKWSSYAIVRKQMTPELLIKMKKAGCVYLCYGVESACDRTLKRMNKFYTALDAERAVRSTHEAGIFAAVNIIVGFPQETEEDFEETLSFIRRNRKYIFEITNISSLVIMPASKLGSRPQEYGVKLPLPENIAYFYTDNNGTGLEERTRRVRKTIFVAFESGIRNPIVNCHVKTPVRKNNLALISCPAAEADTLPARLARLSSYMHRSGFAPFSCDINSRLYKSAPERLKPLWEAPSRHLWILPGRLLKIFNLLEKELLELTEQLISLETNIFCFLIEKDNLLFSVNLASILKKCRPNITVIFSSQDFNDKLVSILVPPGTIDFFVFAEEEETLRDILANLSVERGSLPNTVIYRDGGYINYGKKGYGARQRRDAPAMNLKETDLRPSDYSRMPLEWYGDI